MWINFTFHHMTDVEKSEISFIMCTIYGILLHFMLFCCKKLIFLRFTLFFRKISLLQFTRYCVEKILAQISDRGEKMTNMRYVKALPPKVHGSIPCGTRSRPLRCKVLCLICFTLAGQF